MDSQTYSKANFDALLLVLDTREAVSSDRDRLRYYFLARGATLSAETPAATSKIYLGDPL